MSLRKKVGALCLVCMTAIAIAQKSPTRTDSLIALVPSQPDSQKIVLLNDIAARLSFSNVRESRTYVEQALAISKRIKSPNGEAQSSCVMCSVLNQQSDYANALTWCKRGLSLYDSLGNQEGIADAYNRTGSVYNLKGDYALALENFFKSLKIKQTLKKTKEIPLLIENIATVYFRQGDYQLALTNFKECYQAYLDQNNIAGASKILVNMGATYNRLKLPKDALDANLKALSFFEQMNNVVGVGIASNNAGNVFIEMKEFTKAIPYYEKSLAIKKKMNDRRGTAVSLRNLSEAYLGLGNLTKAKTSVEASLKIAQEINSKEQIKDAYGILATVHERMKNFAEALRYEKKFAEAKDSLFSTEKTEQISKMRAIYETEKAERQKVEATLELNKKDAAITLLNKENEVRSTQRNFFVVAAASLLLLTLLAFYLFQQKRKSNELLFEKNQLVERSLHERETLLKEIHHRVKNNLQIISSLLSLQSKNTQDSATQHAISESRNRVKSMSLIHEQLYQENIMSGVEMKNYLLRLVNSLVSSYGINTEKVDVKVDADEMLLDVDSAIPLGLIINELVSNSMKYAFPDGREGSIIISFRDTDQQLKLIVADTGVGMNGTKSGEHSFGLSMVNSLMRKLKAEMDITSSGGTRIELTIKDFKKIVPAT